MKCNKVKKKIAAYLDGELNPVEKNEFLLHINGCESCSEELEDMEFAVSLIKPLEPIKPSPYFYSKIRNNIGTQHSGNVFTRLVSLNLNGLSIALSTLIMLLLGSILGNFVIPENNGYPVRTAELKNALNLGVFNDIAEDSFGMVYNDLLKEKK